MSQSSNDTFPSGHAHRRRRTREERADSRGPPGAAGHRRQGQRIRRRGEDRPHPPDGRHSAHVGQEFGGWASLLERDAARLEQVARRPVRSGHRRHGRRHRPERPSGICRARREENRRAHPSAVPLASQQVRRAFRARRTRLRPRRHHYAGLLAHENLQRHSLAGLRPAQRPGGDQHPGERAGLFDHARQGQSRRSAKP